MAHHFGPLITPQTFELLPKIVVETKLTFTNTSMVNGILLSVECRFSSSILDVIRHEKTRQNYEYGIMSGLSHEKFWFGMIMI